MIPIETERLWEEYLATERVRVRQQSLGALENFIGVLLQTPPDVWHPWARQLAQRIVDEGEDVPVRLPLFRLILFPALLVALKDSVPGSARWLARFAPLLSKSPFCREQLPDDQRSEYGLLSRAVQDDPSDTRAKKRLLNIMRSQFEYALHELPAGVLYGHDGATIEQCNELMEDLFTYERLAVEIGPSEHDQELIAEARFHISAYQRYLIDRGGHANYAGYLSAYKRA